MAATPLETSRLKSWWRALSREALAGAAGVGAYYDRRHLVLAHLEKGFTGCLAQHVVQLEVPDGGLAALAPQVQELVTAWGLTQPPAGLAVSSRLGLVRPAVLPAAAKAHLARVVGYEIDRFLPLSADQLVYDFQVVGETETEVRLLLMAVPRALVEEWLALCAAAGLSPVSVEPAPLAAANAFAVLHRRPPSAWLLLAADAEAYDLLEFAGRRLRSWRAGLGVPELPAPEPEGAGTTGPGEGPRALYVAGGAALRPQVAAWQERLPFPVVSDTQVVLKGPAAGRGAESWAFPAMGSALRGLGRVPFPVNLLPESDRAVTKLTGLLLTRFFLILLLSLAVVWLGSIFIQSRITLAKVERQVAQLAPEVREVEKQLSEAQNLVKQYHELKRRVEQYPGALPILRDLTQIIPEHTHLFSFRLSKGQVELSGKSASASDLISILEKSGRFTRTEFISPIVTDETGSEIFKIKADIKGAARGS